MLHLYHLECQATAQARATQDAILRRQRLDQARDAVRRPARAIRSALHGGSLPSLAAACIGQPGTPST